MFNLNVKIDTMTGVGKTRSAAFDKIGITDVRSLLYHFPRAYQHRGNVKNLSEVTDGEICSIILTVATSPTTSMLPNRRRMTLTKFMAVCTDSDDRTKCGITFFNREYLSKVFSVGMTYRFYGKISVVGSRFEMTSPNFEPYSYDVPMHEFIPIYSLSAGITQKFISGIVMQSLNMLENNFPEAILNEEICRENNLCGYHHALKNIHFPDSFENMNAARDYFIFEELFLFALGTAVSGQSVKSSSIKSPHISPETLLTPFFEKLPFKPTGAQLRAIDDIFGDMSQPSPMMRLISGDVGSGKTICAAAAIYISAKNGWQSALMAPTEILASQHFNDLNLLFGALGITCVLLTGSVASAQKKKIYSGLADGSIDVCIGTHALISKGVEFCRLGLAVTDEQHRFGVHQRSLLSKSNPHVLIMSATPIPRTLAMILYGDLTVSTIDELPPGRQKIDTFVVNESYRSRLNSFIKKQVEEGHQVYIVCPSVEGSTDADATESESNADSDKMPQKYEIISFFDEDIAAPPLKNTKKYAEELRITLPEINISVIHGKMKASEKDSVMANFVEGTIDVLVSTTVIEVGVNVPNATLMIVENAERFGLSQLHQLRGRVGRGNAKSYCVLVSDSAAETARKRLAVMHSTNDGYEIAKYDLELRGPGDFFPKGNGSARQHGDINFRIASLCDNIDVVKKSFEYAKEIVQNDPTLENHTLLKNEVARLFGGD